MAKPEELVTFLAKVPLFHELNKKHLQKLANRFVTRNYSAGQKIVTQGKGGEGMFTIVSGHVETVLEMADGTQTVVNEFGPMDFFGEVAMLDDGPRTASIITTEETECLVLSRSDFISLMNNDAEMATEIAIALAKRLRRAVGAL
jgi:CRP/FNR family cyclic AMP-dependent transcriptional regulator